VAKKGLYANIHAKRKRIKAGSKEKMRKKGSKGAPTNKAFKKSKKQLRRSDNLLYYCYSIVANEYNYVYRIYWKIYKCRKKRVLRYCDASFLCFKTSKEEKCPAKKKTQ